MENAFNSITTLDVDTTDKEKITHILGKIIYYCPHIVDFKFKFSSKKGIHFILFCSKKCDLCRFVFDDFRRYAYDRHRPKYAQNILFDKKECL